MYTQLNLYIYIYMHLGKSIPFGKYEWTKTIAYNYHRFSGPCVFGSSFPSASPLHNPYRSIKANKSMYVYIVYIAFKTHQSIVAEKSSSSVVVQRAHKAYWFAYMVDRRHLAPSRYSKGTWDGSISAGLAKSEILSGVYSYSMAVTTSSWLGILNWLDLNGLFRDSPNK